MCLEMIEKITPKNTDAIKHMLSPGGEMTISFAYKQ